jgi:hypothetical protein
MSSKSVSSLLLTASLLSGLVFTGAATEALAGPIRTRQTTQVPVRPGSSPQITAQASIVGQWKGNMNYQGDDVLTHLELSIPAGGGAASWKHIGSKQVNGQWVDAVLKQGSLSRSVEGNQVQLTLHNFYSNSPVLVGSFQNGGQKIAGHEAGQPSLLFSFNK